MKRNMKLINVLMGIILFSYASLVSSTTINGRFTVLNVSNSDFTVLIQINTNTGTDDLGGATIVFGFDTTVISITENPIKNVDYIFYNFCGGNYSSATVTRPMKNKIWINIDLPFSSNNNGTPVAVSPEWTDVVSLHFDLIDPNGTASLDWLTTSPFWGIYDANNSTLWEAGVFEDFPTSVEPILDLPKSFELSQNYPNPFNPSTKIKFTIPSVTLSGVEGTMSVLLKVYDILGNEVATLVDEEREPGVYELEFYKIRLASGVYIYRMEAGDPSGNSGHSFVDTKKMVLLR
jgi:hypothetical protein